MKAAALALVLLASCAFGQSPLRAPDIPVADPDPGFPLHLHILNARWGINTIHLYRSVQGEMRGGPGYYQPSGGSHGFGTANLLADPVQGFDYSFNCPSAFQTNAQPGEFYQARWKHPGQSLEILMQPVGSGREELCELKVSLKAHPFDTAHASTLNNNPLNGSIWTEPEIAFPGDAPDYPVHLHILSGQQHVSDRGVQGYGTANLLGPTPQGVDYTYDCAHGLIANSQPDEFFSGHWVKPNQRVEILTVRIGTDRVDRCQLNITLKPTPYSASTATDSPSTPSTSSGPVLSRR